VINSQIDLAAESKKGQVLSKVVEESSRIMRQLQTSWMALVDQEMKKQLAASTQPEDLAPGLVEYIMALANDQVKSANFVETLLNRLEPVVSDKYRGLIVDTLNDAMDGFLDVAKKCVQVLIQIVFNDLKPATKILFQSAWYAEDPVVQIVETISDYTRDFAGHLNPSLFELLVDDIIDTFLITYLSALKKASKLKTPQAGNRMREDIRRAFEFFLQLKQPRSELELHFGVLDALHKIVTASKTMFYLDYRPFAKRFGAQLPYIEAILKARDDLDKRAVSEIMEAVRNKVVDEDLPESDKSIFARLPTEKGYLGFVGL
jgi:exocyst complex component 3